jgi:hypothetical protein
MPAASTGVGATAGNAQATVSWTAPSDGGSVIVDYTVTSNPGGRTVTGLSSPLTVTGLTNGVGYTFTVTARNSVGSSVASIASNSVTPQSDQSITFADPGAQNFGTTPTLSATSTSGLSVVFTSATTGVCTITGGGAVTFVTAGACTINANQVGDASFLAASQVSRSFTVNTVAPGPPTISSATAGNTQATITFTPPVNTGGSVITSYTVTSSPSGFTGTGPTSPITVTGLANGTSYTFTLTATNSAGIGSASSASSPAVPQGSQTITFADPGAQNFGTTPTLSATSTSGLSVAFTSATTGVCTITGGGAVTFVTAGACTINANQVGDASFLAASQVSRSFTVNALTPGPRAAQIITFVNPGAHNVGATPTLTATSTSGLSVVFTSATTGVCTITRDGETVLLTSGTCTINANQVGDASFLAASQESQSFTVNALTPGPPTPAFSATQPIFPETNINSVSPHQIVTVTSSGGIGLDFRSSSTPSQIYVGGPDAVAFRIIGNTCSGTIVAPSFTCSVTLEFAPITMGVTVASLIFESSNLSGGPHYISLFGTTPGSALAEQPAKILPSDVTQQVGLPLGQSCNQLKERMLNWADVGHGGWTQSWAQWMNSGLGGSVCTRTLYFVDVSQHWSVR